MSNINVLAKKNDKMKSNFSKLTLSSKKTPCAIKIPIVSNAEKRNWEQNLYNEQNNTNTDDLEKSVLNNYVLTDDDSDSEAEKENIIQNKILFSSPRLEKENVSSRQNQLQTPVLSQLFSEKLQVSDSDETNFSEDIENVVNKKEIHDWITKLNKFESSESQSNAKISCSRNLFSQNTDELEILIKTQMENKKQNQVQSDVNTLSATLESLELANKNILNTISNTNNIPSVKDIALAVKEKTNTGFQEQTKSNVLKLIKAELNKTDHLELISTILTLSSSNSSTHSSQNINKSIICISDSDISSGEYSRNVSSLNQNDELNSSTLDQLDNFFNNIPSLEEEIVINSESKNSSLAKSSVQEELLEKSNICISESDPEDHNKSNDEKEENILSDKVIVESNTSTDNRKEKLSNESVILSKQETQESINTKNDASPETYIEKINISAKIKIHLKITELLNDSKSTKSNDNDNDVSSSEDIKRTNESNDENEVEEENKTKNESPVIENPSNTSYKSYENTNLDKSLEIIDLGMEKILNEIYGKEWQTPEIIKKCESIKKVNPRQPTTLDSTYINDFNTFHLNRNSNLESTRINQLDIEFDGNTEKNENKLQINNVESPRSRKNTPIADKIRTKLIDKFRKDYDSSKEKSESPWFSKKTPAEKSCEKISKRVQSIAKRGTPGPSKLQERINTICDSDSTMSSDSEDDKFIKKPVKKSGAIPKQKSVPSKPMPSDSSDENNRDNKKTFFTPKKINDIDVSTKALKFLDSCEFKKKSIMSRHSAKPDNELETNSFKKPMDLFVTPIGTKTKRKLYTPSYDIVPELENTIETEEKEITADIPSVKANVILKQPLPSWMTAKDKRLESIKSMEIKSPIGKKSDDEKLLTPKSNSKNAYEAIDFCVTPPNVYGFLRSLDVMVGLQFCHPKALQYRNNYKNNKEELTEILYRLYNEKIFDNKLDVAVQWNKKLLNTAGRCNNRRKGQIKSCVIDLSEKVLTSADRLRCTLVHELCHAAAWLFDSATGHGAEWKRWATRANKIFPELPKINVCHQYEIEYKYTYECEVCNARSYAHSKSKKVEKIRCSYCHGAIKILLNKKDKEGNIVRTPTREASGFAKFVKDKYKTYKNPDLTHAEVMKLLSNEFNSMKMRPE